MAEAGAGAGAGAGMGVNVGKEDPVTFLSSLSFEIATDKEPSSYLFKTEDGQSRQLITVIAKLPSGDTYWRQVFYNSSGTASKIKGAWFPISAVVPGEAGFYKKNPVTAEYFKVYDKLYEPSQFFKENDMRVRIKTFSFLLAINQLVNGDIFDKIYDELSKVLDEKQMMLLSKIIDSKLSEQLITKIPQEPKYIEASSPAYEAINTWIGVDNYSGQPAVNILHHFESNSLLPSAWKGGRRRRKRPTRKQSKRPKRHTRRSRRR
jgi:hypothetical protein